MAVDFNQLRRMTPAGLDLFKRQAALRAQSGDPAFARLVSMPEYQALEQVQPPQEQPLWMKGLQTATAPFRWIEENITQPFGAIVTSPFTPSVEGTENLPWLQREREEYRQWDDPSLGVPFTDWQVGVKGIVETLPWLAVPSFAGVAGRLGMVAARGGMLGRAAGLGAKALGPAVAAEALPGKLVGKALSKSLGRVTAGVGERSPALVKLTSLIESAKPARIETGALRHEELSKRVGKAAGLLQRGEGREAFLKSKTALKGELPKADFIPIEAQLKPDEITSLFNTIRDSEFRYFDKLNTSEALQKLLLGEIPQGAELGLLEKMFGSELVRAVLKKRSLGTRVWEQIMDIANMPRAVLASWDLSGLLRQGGILTARHPIQSSKAAKGMLKAFTSEKHAVDIDNIIRGRKYFNLGQDAGLYHAPLIEEAVKLGAREEMFMSRFARYFPLVKPSERAFVTVLNDLRSRTWEHTVSMWERAGANATMRDYNELAKLINFASGRGSLGPLRGTGPLFNATLFSPRLLLSRMQLPTMLFSKSPLVRKEAFKMLSSFLGAGTSILAMLSLSGAAEVELDPRSADFGKAKIGDSRLDFWTGYIQFERFVTQLITAQRKTQAGNIQDLNRREVVDRFMQTKYSPAFGLLNDILRGESYMGEEMALDTKSLSRQAFNRLVPLFVQDMADAIGQEGVLGGVVVSPALFGVGAITYRDEVNKIRDKLAEPYGILWEGLDRKTQLGLERSSPELQAAMKEREEKMRGETEVSYYSYGKEVEKSYQQQVMNAVRKFRATGNGAQFRKDIDLAAYARRMGYSTRDSQAEFSKIVDRLNTPLTPQQMEGMHSNDIGRRAYYDMLYADDMIDEFGEYRYEEADRRKAQFVQQWGQGTLDYVESLFGSKWEQGEPPELVILRQARELLQPYWEIENQVWAQFPPQLKEISDQIQNVERTDQSQADRMLLRYPQIVWARKQIAFYRKFIKQTNPAIAQALATFYIY